MFILQIEILMDGNKGTRFEDLFIKHLFHHFVEKKKIVGLTITNV